MYYFAQIRQYFWNNLRFGENDRRQNRAAHLHAMDFEARLSALSLISPDYGRVWGIDISHWDGNVTLSVTKSLGAWFVFIKALDGTIQSRYFAENRARALAADLPHGPYGWLYPNANVSCTAQAQAYNNIVQKYPPVMPPVIDFEWTRYAGVQSNPNYDDLRKWAVEWLRLGNPKPILYSAAGYMNSVGQIPADLKSMFSGIWIANYGVVNPLMPYGYSPTEWEFHQFTSSGDAFLIAPNDVNKKELDLNYFNGSGELFSQRYLGGTTPPPNGGGMNYIEGSVIVGAVKIRQSPGGAEYNPPRYLINGDRIKASEVYDGRWLKLTEVNGVPAVGWSSAGSGQEYISWKWVSVPEPEPPPPTPEPGVTISGIRYSGEVVFDYSDGTQEVWHISDAPLTKGPAT